ncbi:hypothetical protein KKF84_05090 [Myxococcota bacterium]|nr:hypothetical protein [Myxococcota bacterium]MBU1534672.1 hypothetical protein [Myxococcota bacterium]
MGFYSLDGESLITYLERLGNLVAGVDCSRYYPSMSAFTGALHLWEPCLDPFVNRSLQLDEVSDLPAESAYTRLANELKLFQRERNGGICSLRKLRSPYYALLEQTPFPRLFSLDLHFRGFSQSPNSARFRAVLDRFDLSEGVLVRYTIDFVHEDSLWQPSLVRLGEGVSRVSRILRNALSTSCQDEAELAVIILSRLPGITVQQLIRGRLGPLWRQGKPMASPFLEILSEVEGTLLLHLPLDGIFTDLKDDCNLDPMANLYRNTLSEESSLTMEKMAQNLGYRVLKERRVALWSPKGVARCAHQLAKKSPHLIIMGQISTQGVSRWPVTGSNSPRKN